jgi:hypothetical protein
LLEVKVKQDEQQYLVDNKYPYSEYLVLLEDKKDVV